MVDQNRKVEVLIRKVGDDFILFHMGTGISLKGRNLDELYCQFEDRVALFLQDMSKIGAEDVALRALSIQPQHLNGAPQASLKRSVAPWIFGMFFFLIVSSSAVLFAANKIDAALKNKELEIRTSLENPTPEQTEARMRQLRKSLKAGEPYLIEIKEFWDQLPGKK